MNEIWKKIAGFENYECSSLGRFRRNGKELKQAPHQKGYLSIRLYKNGKQFTKRSHRVIFETFVNSIDSEHEINHINGVKNDNRIENLECVTHSENIRHALKERLIVPVSGKNHYSSTPIVATHIITGETRFFETQADAAKQGFNQGCIQFVLKNKRNHHKMYKWNYAN